MIDDQQGIVVTAEVPQVDQYQEQTTGPRITMHQAALGWIEEVYKLNSRSEKTRMAYKTILTKFDLYLQDKGLQLDSDPRQVGLKLQEWVVQPDPKSKKEALSNSSINQRYAALSSYYAFAIRFGACEVNPVTFCKRMKRNPEHAAPALEQAYIEEKLALIDTATREGMRDLAFIVLGFMTGRRLSELASLQWKHITVTGEKMHVLWARCKGRKIMEDDLSPFTSKVVFAYLRCEFGPDLQSITPDSFLFRSHSNRNQNGRLSASAISKICLDRLGFSQVHVLRHSNAVNRELAGFTLSQIGDLLGHSNYATTADYLKAKRKQVYTQQTSKLESMFGLARLSGQGREK